MTNEAKTKREIRAALESAASYYSEKEDFFWYAEVELAPNYHSKWKTFILDTATQAWEKAESGEEAERSEVAEPTEGLKPTKGKKKNEAVSIDLPNLVDIIMTDSGPQYLIKQSSNLVVCNSFPLGGILHHPPREIKLWLPPTPAVFDYHETDTDQVLFDDVSEYILGHVELSKDVEYKIMAAWVFHTYLLENFDYSPYLYFYGPVGSGKSRAGEILRQLSFRAIFTVGITEASIFRVTELYKPTLIVDELNLWGKEGNTAIQQMLNCRFQRGQIVIRINQNKQGFDSIEQFNIFGATAICTTEEAPEALQSRRLLFTMEKNTRRVKRKVDEVVALKLRNRLTAFRARHFKESLEEPEAIVYDGRLDDVILPLHQVVRLCDPRSERDFVNFCEQVEKHRFEELATSLDAIVVSAVQACKHSIEGGKFLVSDVALEVNKDRSQKEQISNSAVGRVLNRLGFRTTRNNQGKMARYWDDQRLKKLILRYRIASEPSEHSDPSAEF